MAPGLLRWSGSNPGGRAGNEQATLKNVAGLWRHVLARFMLDRNPLAMSGDDWHIERFVQWVTESDRR
jgi:hypothetical protein